MYKYNPELIGGEKNSESFINFVKKHNNNIEKFFNSKPQAKFISFDVENDPSEKLSKYINLNGNKFPHSNKTIKKQFFRKKLLSYNS